MLWFLFCLLIVPPTIYVAPMLLRVLAVRRLQAKCTRLGAMVLTYDDGPSPETTPKLLELLAERGAHATFFMLGSNAERYPDLVQQVLDGGHEIGSHSQEHLHAWKRFPAPVLRDVNRGHETLSPWTSESPPFRPPYGKITLFTLIWSRLRGAALGWWTHDSADSKTPMPATDYPAASVKKTKGGVVLLHDLDRSPERNGFVLAATEQLLDTAQGEDLQVLSLNELAMLRN